MIYNVSYMVIQCYGLSSVMSCWSRVFSGGGGGCWQREVVVIMAWKEIMEEGKGDLQQLYFSCELQHCIRVTDLKFKSCLNVIIWIRIYKHTFFRHQENSKLKPLMAHHFTKFTIENVNPWKVQQCIRNELPLLTYFKIWTCVTVRSVSHCVSYVNRRACDFKSYHRKSSYQQCFANLKAKSNIFHRYKRISICLQTLELLIKVLPYWWILYGYYINNWVQCM